ncbi:PrsW family intramembrane metalloprotease [Nocardiopsis changdeensis]|uniref:PrsW family intramembrane metalloprotease n=1 Tax=Nocardiopsis changdeensis TaxID=2831969 RepID=A0ABX8BGH7_9ACTN|nr:MULTISPECIES: PrsW family intramembrane metalloprotease [Nocardiopsis]QUX21132.1 PrsW family intramembrane metalloprotease [Nocardiopsis changdeensis]QYX37061.1 PrsW family intramembrane metalloprotease [Nocardiopsis sp. MT53]
MSQAPNDPRTPDTAAGTVPAQRRRRRNGPGPQRVPAPRAPEQTVAGYRLPAFVSMVVIGVLCLLGLVTLAVRLGGTVRVFFAEAALGLVFAAATLLFGFWLFRRIRPVRAPDPAASLVAVAWGLTAATGGALLANSALTGVWSKTLGLEFSAVWGAAMTAPFNEELFKLAGIVLVAVAFPRAVRGPVDGFVIGALVGLGFEVTENLIYGLNTVVQAGGVNGGLAVAQTAVLRVLLTGLGSHWAMSAVAGAGVGLLAAAGWLPGGRRVLGASVLVLTAMAMHWLFDSPLLDGFAGIVFKVLLNFGIAMAVYFAARHAHRRRVRRALALEAEEAGLRRSAAVALARRRARRRALHEVPEAERAEARRVQALMVESAEDRAFAHTV